MKQELTKKFSASVAFTILAVQIGFVPIAAVPVASHAEVPITIQYQTGKSVQPEVSAIHTSNLNAVELVPPPGTLQYTSNGLLMQGSGQNAAAIFATANQRSAASLLRTASQATIAVAPSVLPIFAINVQRRLATPDHFHYTLETTRSGLPVAAAIVDPSQNFQQPEVHVFAARIFTVTLAALVPRTKKFAASTLSFNLLC